MKQGTDPLDEIFSSLAVLLLKQGIVNVVVDTWDLGAKVPSGESNGRYMGLNISHAFANPLNVQPKGFKTRLKFGESGYADVSVRWSAVVAMSGVDGTAMRRPVRELAEPADAKPIVGTAVEPESNIISIFKNKRVVTDIGGGDDAA